MNIFIRGNIFILMCLFFISNSQAQNFAIGGSVGGGYIGGDSPNIGSFNTSIFIDFDLGISEHFYNRMSFIYSGDFESILPGTRNTYFPFIKGIALKGITTQDYEDNYFLEEGLGFVYLNDRTLSSTNTWNFGAVFSLAAGINLTDQHNKGFNIALGTDLWTKEMLVDDMNIHTHQVLLKLADTYRKATKNPDAANMIENFASDFADKLDLKKKVTKS